MAWLDAGVAVDETIVDFVRPIRINGVQLDPKL
jgi:hypothetical protein